MVMGLISNFASGLIRVRRQCCGEYVNGIWRPGKFETKSITGSIQPLRGNELMMLPEAERTRDARLLYTDERLFTSDEKNKRQADKIEYASRLWEVHSVEDWQDMTDLPHYKSIILNIDGQGEGERK